MGVGLAAAGLGIAAIAGRPQFERIEDDAHEGERTDRGAEQTGHEAHDVLHTRDGPTEACSSLTPRGSGGFDSCPISELQ